MTESPAEEFCPYCGQSVSLTAARCRSCGRSLTEDIGDRRGAARQEPAVQPTDFLIPTNVSAWSIASCYLGLVGFCLPIVGLVFAVPAFICGIIALRKRRKATSYGAVTSDIRAIIGLVLSSLAILGWGVFLVVMLVAAATN